MKKIIKIEELQKCTCFNFRLIARELTNQYNYSLKSSGIKSTQVPILAILNIYKKVETKKIAKILSIETSTIRRNLMILQKKNLIKIIKKDINGNLLSLTNDGYLKFKEILPIWRKSNVIARKNLNNYVKTLQSIL